MPLSDDEFNELLQKRLVDPSDPFNKATVLNQNDSREDFDSEDSLSEEDEADLAIMQEALSHYKAESLAWAEQRSAALPPPRSSTAAALWDRAPRWALAGVAVTACAVAALTLNHTNAVAPRAVAIAPSAQTLAADNQLLSSVDDALAGSRSNVTEQELGLSYANELTGAHDTQKHGHTQNSTN